jgi:hypothetical protein
VAHVAERAPEEAPAERAPLTAGWEPKHAPFPRAARLSAHSLPPAMAARPQPYSDPETSPAWPVAGEREPYAEIRRLATAVRAGDDSARHRLLQRLEQLARGSARRAAG